MIFIMVKPNAISTLTEKKVKSPKESAVFDHIFHKSHSAGFDDFETLVKESGEFRLLTKSLLILHDDPLLNRYVSSILLELFHNYLNLVYKFY